MRVFDRDPIHGGHYGQRAMRTALTNTWLHTTNGFVLASLAIGMVGSDNSRV